MKSGTSPLSVAASIALLAVAGAGIAGVLGAGAPVLRGTVAGLVLGWAGSALELRLMRPHLASDLPRALRVLTAGFGIRLLAILVAMTVLEGGGLADGSAFGVSVVAGFLCFLPVLASAVRPRTGNGEARG